MKINEPKTGNERNNTDRSPELDRPLDHKAIVGWLRETDEQRLEALWAAADSLRRERVGDEVHLRGLIEIGNYCVRQCGYCGLRAGHKELKRYRMNRDEILECADEATQYGYGTVVLQAGEDYGIKADWIAGIISEIKACTPLAVTLSLGERSDEDLRVWRQAGADRYLLRFETSDPDLYSIIHPDRDDLPSDRMAILRVLKKLGYETGSGVMIGIPGQTYECLARDIEVFRHLDLDMVGVGPYIAHPDTPLGRGEWLEPAKRDNQVSGTELMALKVIALTRMVCPEANIPSTTALATLNKASGRELGLIRGGNVVMPNLTPRKYRAMYEIYPAKACLYETAAECRSCMRRRIESIGRRVGSGRGDRKVVAMESE